jgi:hypothetical protein
MARVRDGGVDLALTMALTMARIRCYHCQIRLAFEESARGLRGDDEGGVFGESGLHGCLR